MVRHSDLAEQLATQSSRVMPGTPTDEPRLLLGEPLLPQIPVGTQPVGVAVGELVAALQRPAFAPRAANVVRMHAMSLREGIVGIEFGWGGAKTVKKSKLDNGDDVWALSRLTLLFRRSNKPCQNEANMVILRIA